jgi:hypothetical protein
MKATQMAHIKNTEADLQRLRQAFQQAHLYLKNLKKLHEHETVVLQQQQIKHEEKRSYDEYLARLASQASM